ncbi:MAG: autotransporter outer membrane beta-barrel domain-containing protein [Deltaproteobacteria bacterium]|nr:autotransporter outer membrane beta-barrel domain-containing protein [Deltaproteobacteria bacterium]
MKKILLVVVGLVVFAFVGNSYSWQGRMEGMGNPYGLVSFTYTDITQWDLDAESGVGDTYYDASGDQQDYGAMAGTAFPVGPGRLGIFFAYEGVRRDVDGDADYSDMGSTSGDGSTTADYDLESDMDDFSLRFIYGLPINVNCLNVGGEMKFAYRDEEQKNKWDNNVGYSFLNIPTISQTGFFWVEANTFMFQIPYDSDYWDAQFKGSVAGKVCPAGIKPIDVVFSFGGGFIFAGDNEYTFEGELDPFRDAYVDGDGDISGWNLGGDLWVRVPVSDTVVLPFVVRGEYFQKNRDGDGVVSDPDFIVGIDNYDFRYEHEEESFMIEAGGGIDMELSDISRMAVGLFYTYLDRSDDLEFTLDDPTPGLWMLVYDHNTPDYKEHRITLKTGWETSLSNSFALRAGINTFYGWINKDLEYRYDDYGLAGGNFERNDGSLEGNQWGINASLGATINLKKVSFEPYINGGYRDVDLDGDSRFTSSGGGGITMDVDESREEWFIGAGLSILFGI